MWAPVKKIFLEEPPEVNFENMLSRSLGVDDYLMPLDLEYSEFSRSMCHLEQELYARGKQLIQLELFAEALLSIHEFLAQGNTPEDLEKDTLPYFVCLAERNATGALLKYYRTTVTGSFEATVEAIRQLARADAARFPPYRFGLYKYKTARKVPPTICLKRGKK